MCGAQAYEELLSRGVPPNFLTFNLLMQACGKAGQLDHALLLLSEMRAADVRPTGSTFNTLIRCATSLAVGGLVHAGMRGNTTRSASPVSIRLPFPYQMGGLRATCTWQPDHNESQALKFARPSVRRDCLCPGSLQTRKPYPRRFQLLGVHQGHHCPQSAHGRRLQHRSL